MSTNYAVDIVDLFVTRASAAPTAAILEMFYRSSLNTIHALYASGLLSVAENEASLALFVDTCHQRHGELLAAITTKQGGAQ